MLFIIFVFYKSYLIILVTLQVFQKGDIEKKSYNHLVYIISLDHSYYFWFW